MEIRILKYFLMAAREENITKAASLLHITQPTLSRQLMQLEEELGVTLFTRSNHRIILTDDGMLLKRRAQELVSLAEKTKMEFLHDENTLAGEIAIGCGETRSMNRLAELMADFRSRYPLVRFEIYSGNVDNIKERMERGLLDLGLFVEPVDVGKYEFLRMPVKETWESWCGRIPIWQRWMRSAQRTWSACHCWLQAGKWCRTNWPTGLGIMRVRWKSPSHTIWSIMLPSW